jgi:protein-disulfide isomerase
MLNRLLTLCVTLIAALGLVSCAVQGDPGTRAGTAAPAPIVTPAPLLPNAEQNGRAWGPPDAPIKVLKFVDFQCPTCAKYETEYEPGIVDAFAATGKVRYEIRILTFIGPESYSAGMAGLCAADQNAFWPMYHLLFMSQPFERENTGQFSKEFLQGLAAQLGLGTQAFGRCMDSATHKAQLDQDAAEAKQYGVGRVPALVINGKLYDSARSVDDLRLIFSQIAPTVPLSYTR